MNRTPHRKPRPTAPAEPADDPRAPAGAKSPAMPHERDEAGAMTGGVPSERVGQGLRDLQRGVQDTSRAPEADTAYRRLRK